jgi:hypothetical protein
MMFDATFNNISVISWQSVLLIRNLAVPHHFVAYLVFISSIRVDPGPRNRGPKSLLALKIRTLVANTGKLRSPWFTVIFVLFCIYTPENLFPRPIVNLVGGLFWILSDSNVSLEEQIWLTECIYLAPCFVKYGSIVAKDWYLFTCCFYTYHVIKKDISFCFFLFFF